MHQFEISVGLVCQRKTQLSLNFMMKIKLFTHLINEKLHLLALTLFFSIMKPGTLQITLIKNQKILCQNKNEEVFSKSPVKDGFPSLCSNSEGICAAITKNFKNYKNGSLPFW